MRSPAIASFVLPLLLMSLLASSFFALSVSTAHAELPDWQFNDFRPLTELPWTRPEPDAPSPRLDEEALRTIFREPNLFIRCAVLADYLRLIDVGDLDRAFDLCIDLEGTQMPDNVVAFFIRIWAERDPGGCWEKVKLLLRVVAIDDGWLAYDSWGNPRITVKNLEAVRASRFWLRSESLLTFPSGVENAKLKHADRQELLHDFSLTWFRTFERWPEPPKQPYGISASWLSAASAFALSPEQLKEAASKVAHIRDAAFYEVCVRQLLVAEPARAPEIVADIHGKVWQGASEHEDRVKLAVISHEPSTEFLQLWSERDMPALLKWAESLPADRRRLALRAKGLLMSRVDAPTRQRWLQESQKLTDKSDHAQLLGCWAVWDFPQAWAAALPTEDAEVLYQVVHKALFPESWEPQNLQLLRAREVAKVDVSAIPPEARDFMMRRVFVYQMELWGDINLGETARYGLGLLQKTGDVPREILLNIFKGSSYYGDTARGDGDVLDRTFCALRIWAVTKPEEMRAWLVTMKDKEMRDALTWLLGNPWGTG